MPTTEQLPAESDLTPAIKTFDNFGLSQDVLVALGQQGLATPTPIQAMAIPLLLQGRDLIGLAQTGTGKTAAFLLPMLTMLEKAPAVRAGHPPHALVLAPTRELANQIHQNLRNLAQHMNIRHIAVFGGARYDAQIRGLRRGVDIVVATPGRLEDLMDRGAFDPSGVTHFVLDEADHMLDLGFYPAIQRIAKSLPKPRQTMLFSATMPPEIEKLASSFLVEPVHVKAPQTGVTADKVTQHVTLLSEGEKRDRLCDILNGPDIDQVLIFVRTRRRADALAKFAQVRGFAVDALHGDMRQSIRQKVLQNFKSGKLRAIIATDVAARGIDVAGLGHVINFDLTDTPEAYIHRIGRTGRAGREGIALSFCAPAEQQKLAAIIAHVGARVELFDPEGSPVTDFAPTPAPRQRNRRQRPPVAKRQPARHKPNKENNEERSKPRKTAQSSRPKLVGAKPERKPSRTPDPAKPKRSFGRHGAASKTAVQPPTKAKPRRAKNPFTTPPVFDNRPNFGDKPAKAKSKNTPASGATSRPVKPKSAKPPKGKSPGLARTGRDGGLGRLRRRG